jgi:hypothetical protein
MSQSYPAGYQSAIGELAADADKGQQPELDLVIVRPPFDADVIESDHGFPARSIFE